MSPKICLICNKSADSNNFGVISCRSCKAFFRRNAYKIDRYVCKKANNCDITKNANIFCKRCRLQKCFNVGMNTDLFLNEQQLRCRRIMNENKLIFKQMSKHTNKLQINDLNTKNNDNRVNELQTVYQINSCISQPINHYKYLSEIECLYIKELCYAMLSIHKSVPDNIKVIYCSPEELTKLSLQKFDNYVNRIIRFAKSLKLFSDLCVNDEIALVKYGAIEFKFATITRYYNTSKSCLISSDMDSNSVIASQGSCKLLRYEVDTILKSALQIANNILESDVCVMNMILALIFFNPNRPNLMHNHMVKYIHEFYMYLLQRYLQVKYGNESIVKSKIIKTQSVVHLIQYMSEIHKQHIKVLNANYCGPVIKEILDIPNQCPYDASHDM
ncbi:oxysterols receptor LXR-alpha-like [Oppia nitens]|uniref:oxysterols receptor LXR-alpha-like n=1 Tax=Oppia nitens TaxID=1686743 RepID=UPI0023DCB890|nr:oxysterols receptor LXR-alpha-like [Oppia nitens]